MSFRITELFTAQVPIILPGCLERKDFLPDNGFPSLFTKDDARQPARAREPLCMDQLVVVMLLFRMWAVLSACRALPAQGVLHPGCCFHGIVAHPLGCQKSWAKNRCCDLPGASQRGTHRCMVHVCKLIWQESILGSCLPA